jgi:hypothetical protein
MLPVTDAICWHGRTGGLTTVVVSSHCWCRSAAVLGRVLAILRLVVLLRRGLAILRLVVVLRCSADVALVEGVWTP